MSKIAFSIQYAGLTLPVVKNDQGRDVTPLKPIADLFGLDWRTQHKKVTNGDFYPAFFGTCIGLMPHAGSQNRDQTCIRLDRIAAFLMGINPERVKSNGNESGAAFLTKKITEWADALHGRDHPLTLKAVVVLNLCQPTAQIAQMLSSSGRTNPNQ